MDGQLVADVLEAAYMSAVCEAFTIPPVAGGAVDQPYALTQNILMLRNYKRISEALDAAMEGGPAVPEHAEGMFNQVIAARWREDKARAEEAAAHG